MSHKRYRLSVIDFDYFFYNIDIFDQESEKIKQEEEKNDQTATQAGRAAPPSSTSKVSLDGFDQGVVQWTIAEEGSANP